MPLSNGQGKRFGASAASIEVSDGNLGEQPEAGREGAWPMSRPM
jgi:hypothetical protein